MRKLFSEILKDVLDAPTQEDKVMVLQTNSNSVIRQLLMAALDPTIVFDVVIPSYRESTEPDGYASNSLYVEARRLYIFMNTYDHISAARKSALLGQILEAIDSSDALVLIQVIKKDLSQWGITKELVNVAFPGLIKA